MNNSDHPFFSSLLDWFKLVRGQKEEVKLLYYIGADLGTSGIKLVLMDELGTILTTAVKNYPVSYPNPGWSEQEPTDWWDAFVQGLKELTRGIDRSKIAALGIDGQMHGLVILDHEGKVIRPAILWNDSRAAREVDYLNKSIGVEQLANETANIAFAGFTAPKLLWVRQEEPHHFDRIRHIMLPKDYLNYRLTGIVSTDYSDASGTLLLNLKSRDWSNFMLDLCGVDRHMMPALYESDQVIGMIDGSIARQLDLPIHLKVVAGASDNAAAAVGAGTVEEGLCNISIGTSGTIFTSIDSFRTSENHSIHHFADANGGYHYLGCMLSAASCNDWWLRILDSQELEKEQSQIKSNGYNRILFLPYLMGERSPHNDPSARGSFLGLSMDTKRSEMTQAVLEGVVFGLRDSIEIMKKSGIHIQFATLCGGGAKSKIWQSMVANILNLEVGLLQHEEGPALGSAILAAVGDGVFPSVEEACRKIVKVKTRITPDPEMVEYYSRFYEIFRDAYGSTCQISRRLSEL